MTLEQPPNEHALLGRLLQKERDPEKMKIVDTIIQQPLSVSEKIQRIQAIDQPVERAEKGTAYSPPASRGIQAGEPVVPEMVHPPRFREVKRNRKLIKRMHPSSSFFSFLFSHALHIRRFGRNTHVLIGNLFFFTCRLHPGLESFFHERLQKEVAAPLLKALYPIRQKSWVFATKRDYNLASLVYDLCERIMKTRITREMLKERGFIEKIRPIESSFLSLCSDPQNFARLLQLIDQCRSELPGFDQAHPKTDLLLRKLLMPDDMLPSLYNVILGANMIRYRRHLVFPELLNPGTGPIVSTKDFDTSPDIYRQIQEYLKDREEELRPLIALRDETFRMSVFLPAEGSTAEDLISAVYDVWKGKGFFEKDRDNIIRFMDGWADFFLGDFRVFLGESIVMEEGSARIFGEIYFMSDFARIELARRNLLQILEIMPTFPRERYLQLLQKRRGAIPNEAAVLQQCEEIISAVISIGRKLQEILQRKMESNPEKDAGSPLMPIRVQKGAFFLPFENRTIQEPAFFRGSSVADAVSSCIRISYQLALYMREASFVALLQRGERLQKKIRELRDILMRIASETEYDRIRAEYGLNAFTEPPESANAVPEEIESGL